MSTDRVLQAVQGRIPSGPGLRLGRQLQLDAVSFTADRLAPAVFFILFLLLKGPRVPALAGRLADAAGPGRLQLLAEIGNTIAVCVFLATVVGLYLFRRRSVRKLSGVWPRTIALSATFVTATLVLAPVTLPGLETNLASSLLIIIGEIIAITGLLFLRRCFGILPEVRGLVTGGPYRHVRHPLYLGESIASVGITLPVLSVWTGAILAAYFLLQWRRALYEESLLAAAIPEYSAYSRRTRQFIPFIW